MASIEDRFKAMPSITRGWFVAALLTTTAVSLGFADPGKLYLNWSLVINNFEIWRLFTNFIFFGPFGMGFAFQLWIMCRMCYAYEENPFPVGVHSGGNRSSADMAMLLIFGGAICCGIGYLMGKPFMGPSLVFMVLYVWSRRNSDAKLGIFGIPILGYQYPWAMLALSVLMGSDPVSLHT
jgi:Derlin-2/3